MTTCLVCEHLIHCLFLQNPIARAWMYPIIQQGCDDLAVFCWLCETSSSSSVEGGLDVFCILEDQISNIGELWQSEPYLCPQGLFVQVAILS